MTNLQLEGISRDVVINEEDIVRFKIGADLQLMQFNAMSEDSLYIVCENKHRNCVQFFQLQNFKKNPESQENFSMQILGIIKTKQSFTP